MIICPNRNDKDYKALEERIGRDAATELWVKAQHPAFIEWHGKGDELFHLDNDFNISNNNGEKVNLRDIVKSDIKPKLTKEDDHNFVKNDKIISARFKAKTINSLHHDSGEIGGNLSNYKDIVNKWKSLMPKSHVLYERNGNAYFYNNDKLQSILDKYDVKVKPDEFIKELSYDWLDGKKGLVAREAFNGEEAYAIEDSFKKNGFIETQSDVFNKYYNATSISSQESHNKVRLGDIALERAHLLKFNKYNQDFKYIEGSDLYSKNNITGRSKFQIIYNNLFDDGILDIRKVIGSLLPWLKTNEPQNEYIPLLEKFTPLAKEYDKINTRFASNPGDIEKYVNADNTIGSVAKEILDDHLASLGMNYIQTDFFTQRSNDIMLNNNKEKLIKYNNDKLDKILNTFFTNIGITKQRVSEIVGQKDAIALADFTNKIIQVVEGKADSKILGEEAAHFFTEILGKDNPLVKKMMSDIANTDIYKEVLKLYSDNKLYQFKDGSLNTNKLKLEAIGKLISEHMSGVLDKASELDIVKTQPWYKRVLEAVKTMFRKWLGVTTTQSEISDLMKRIKELEAFSNPYQESARQILSGNKLNTDNIEGQMLHQTAKPSHYDIAKSHMDAQDKIQRFDYSDENTGAEAKAYRILPTGKIEYNTFSKISKGEIAGKSPKIQSIDEETKKFWEREQNAGLFTHAAIEDIGKTFIEKDYQSTFYENLSEIQKRIYNTIKNGRNNNGGIINLLKTILEDDALAVIKFEMKLYDPTLKWVDKNNKSHIGAAGTADMVVFHTDGTHSIYEFKTSGKKTEDLAVYKMKEWEQQLSYQSNALISGNKSLNVIPSEGLKNKRVIKFQTKHSPSGILIDSIITDEIPMFGESTGDVKTDLIIIQIQGRINILQNKKLKGAKREVNNETIKNLRDLQIKILKTKSIQYIIDNAEKDILSIYKIITNESIDTITQLETINKVMPDLEMYKNIGSMSEIESLSDEDKARFSKLSGDANRYINIAHQIQLKFLKRAANMVGIPEEELDVAYRNPSMYRGRFGSLSQMTQPEFRMLRKLLTETFYKNEQYLIPIVQQMKEHETAIKKWGSVNGVTGIDIYKKILEYKSGEWTGNFVNRWSSEYWTKFNKSIKRIESQESRQWLRTNLELDEEYFKTKRQEYKQELENDSRNTATDIELKLQKWESKNSDISTANSQKFFKIRESVADKWESDGWKYIHLPENKALLDFKEFYTNTIQELSAYLPLEYDLKDNFVANISKKLIEDLTNGGESKWRVLVKSFKNSLGQSYRDDIFNEVYHDVTGKVQNEIPYFYTDNIDPKDKSMDLMDGLYRFVDMAVNYKNMSEIEAYVEALSQHIKTKGTIATDASGKVIPGEMGNPKILPADSPASERISKMFDQFVSYYVYGKHVESGNAWTNVLGMLQRYTAAITLTLSPITSLNIAMSNSINLELQTAKGKFGTTAQSTRALRWMSGGDPLDPNGMHKALALLNTFHVFTESDVQYDLSKLSFSTAEKVLGGLRHIQYAGMRVPDKFTQNWAFLTFIQAHTIQDGIIVYKEDIKRKLRKDKGYYDTDDISERRKIKKEVNEEVEKMPDLMELSKVGEDGKAYFDGITLTQRQIVDFREKARQMAKNVIGNMDPKDVYATKQNALMRALMLFRNWMPRMIDERYGELRYNYELESWEKGKYVTLFKHIFSWQKDEAGDLKWKLLDPIGNAKIEYQKYMKDHNTKIGSDDYDMNITEEEFIDLYIQNLHSAFRGMAITGAMMSTMWMMGAMGGGDLTDKNRYGVRGYFLKAFSRTISELSFYANPAEAVTLGTNISAVFRTLTNFQKTMNSGIKWADGQLSGDQKKVDQAHFGDNMMNMTRGGPAYRWLKIISGAEADINKK